MPKAFNQEEKQRIISQIKEAAMELFARYGLKRTRIQDITDAIGIAKGSFYAFYPSKELLFMDMLEEMESGIQADMFSRMRVLENPEPHRLLKVLKELILEVLENPLVNLVFERENWQYLMQHLPAERVRKNLEIDYKFASQILSLFQQEKKLEQREIEFFTSAFRSVFFLYMHKKEIGERQLNKVMDFFITALFVKILK
ncbi:MAG: TetR/AcrR family transcriptional regulator [Spirochaetales bacterium]|nr:TetR/AcrR family transcriptional regulator [Spirochaetales bacterium]